jgi:HEPN domain-containing protein
LVIINIYFKDNFPEYDNFQSLLNNIKHNLDEIYQEYGDNISESIGTYFNDRNNINNIKNDQDFEDKLQSLNERIYKQFYKNKREDSIEAYLKSNNEQLIKNRDNINVLLKI